MALRLAEAQQLYDALADPLLRPALAQFFADRREDALNSLVAAVRQSVRDTMKEARYAGAVSAYENAIEDLHRFAEKQLQEAAQ